MAGKPKIPTRKPKTAAKSVDIDPNELVPHAQASLGGILAALDRQAKRLTTKIEKAKVYDRDSVSHLAWVGKQISQMVGEVSKLDARAAKIASQLSPALVMAYLRNLDPERRAQVVRELEAMDSTGSVL